MEHFPASKATVALAVATSRKDESQGRRPHRVRPSSGLAGLAGAESSEGKSERLKKRKAQEQEVREAEEDGGHAFQVRGEARHQGIPIPAGDEHTCLPDSCHTLLKVLFPHLKLNLKTVRKSMPALPNSDPNFTVAQTFVKGYGAELCYDRRLNNPKALFKRRDGVYLVQLQLQTNAGDTDQHYVAYLAETGHVVDNYPRAPVLIVDDSDRQSNKRAVKVFKPLFPGAERITMKAVSELRRTDAADRKSRFTCGLLFEPVSTKFLGYSPLWSQPTKPTHKDLFLELYDQKVINYDELVDCIK